MFLTLCDFGYGFNEVLKPHKSVPPFIEKMKKRYNLRNKQPTLCLVRYKLSGHLFKTQ